ncbi:MAG: hypothetical protein LBP56_02850 [Odoribacteraceae bacterium]|jgi:hypothetical protein|nr:hypothetical protein [Odoribacteraceae bacterium]
MYKFKRRIFVGNRSMEFWFGLTSKSRDRHSNFTLYLLVGGPESPCHHAEQIKSGIHSKNEAIRIAISYAKELFQNLIEREKGSHK